MACESSWSDLPQDILQLIFDSAKDPVDILQCGAACKSWLPTALEVYPKFLPVCFVQTGKGTGVARLYWNILISDFRKIKLPEIKGKFICSCSDAWLFIVDHKILQYKAHLLNAFSRTKIDLPPPRIAPVKSLYRSCKILLSKSPLDSDCIVFLVTDKKN